MLCPFAHPVDMFLFFIILDMVLKQLSSFEGGKERGGGGRGGGKRGGGKVGGWLRSCQNLLLNRPFYSRGLSKDVRLRMTFFW